MESIRHEMYPSNARVSVKIPSERGAHTQSISIQLCAQTYMDTVRGGIFFRAREMLEIISHRTMLVGFSIRQRLLPASSLLMRVHLQKVYFFTKLVERTKGS